MRWGSGNGKGSPAFTGQVILLFCRMLRVAHVPGRSQDHLRVSGVDKRQGGAATIRRDGGFQKACITVACHRPSYGGLLRLGQTGRSDLRPASGRDQMSSNVGCLEDCSCTAGPAVNRGARRTRGALPRNEPLAGCARRACRETFGDPKHPSRLPIARHATGSTPTGLCGRRVARRPRAVRSNWLRGGGFCPAAWGALAARSLAGDGSAGPLKISRNP